MMTGPGVRAVKVRLMGEDDDTALLADLLTRYLSGLTQGRCQTGETSAPYPNRRGTGVRRYLEVYVIDDATTTATPATPDDPPSTSGPQLPAGS
ncbi:hypothetical protein ACQP1W_36940 [Spirillospora sp. CA-255316]